MIVDGYGYGHMGWGGWLEMSIAVMVWTALVVILAVWATRDSAPSPHSAREALDARVADLEAEVTHLREQAHLTHRDGTGSRR